jgi:lysophospholipid acyltransferase (LPLAT)-like uncharacterized protein
MTAHKEKGRKWWFRLALFLMPRMVSVYSWFMDLTTRKIVLNGEREETCRQGPFTCACLHGSMLYPVYYCRRYPGVIMVSRSWDGELIDRVLRRWGFKTVRGSSSRGGKDALAAMIEVVNKERCNAGLAVDAPRGPAGRVKMGVVLLARDTDTPIVPMVSYATRKIQFNSWDKMFVALPFGTIVSAFGKPVRVPKGLDREDYEKIRVELENDLAAITRQAQEAAVSVGKSKAPAYAATCAGRS